MVNGTWERNGHLYVFKNARTFPLEVSKETTYMELVDKVYKRVDIDRSKYDLKFEVPYEAGNMPIEPALLKDDMDVKYYTKNKSRRSYALCVTLVSKEVMALTPKIKDKGKNVMNEELSRVELNKRQHNLITNDRDDNHVCNSRIDDRDDEVYKRDRYDYHNNDLDDDDKFDLDDGNNCDKGTEFEEFVNTEEYEDFVKHFTVPSGQGEPSGHGEPSRNPHKVVPPTDCVPYSWKAPEFTTDDFVKEEHNDDPSRLPNSSTGIKNEMYLYS